MADEESPGIRFDENKDNIFDILQKQTSFSMQNDGLKLNAPEEGSDTSKAPVDGKREHRNLPGLHYTLQQNVDDMEKPGTFQSSISPSPEAVTGSKIQTSPPEAKRPRLQIPSPTVPSIFSNNSNNSNDGSPESGKRRRIQHDYRRLSSAGYVDDYEKGKDSRFSLTNDSDTSPVLSKPRSNSSSPRTKSPIHLSGFKLPTLDKQAVVGK